MSVIFALLVLLAIPIVGLAINGLGHLSKRHKAVQWFSLVLFIPVALVIAIAYLTSHEPFQLMVESKNGNTVSEMTITASPFKLSLKMEGDQDRTIRFRDSDGKRWTVKVPPTLSVGKTTCPLIPDDSWRFRDGEAYYRLTDTDFIAVSLRRVFALLLSLGAVFTVWAHGFEGKIAFITTSRAE